jgi:queuine/archaeosine tRNA-ribosyltransferase
MSKQPAKNGRIAALEERVAHLEEQIAFLEKQVQAHSHSITDETVLSIANYVKSEIARVFAPPPPVVEQAEAQAEKVE